MSLPAMQERSSEHAREQLVRDEERGEAAVSTRASNERATIADGVDFDLHGLVGIRLVNATSGDVTAVRRQLGPIQQKLSRQPDIVIRFVRHLQLPSSIRLLGLGETGFTDDDYLVLRASNHAPVKVNIPFEHLGGPCEIVCESGLPSVPLLIAIINLTALANEALPLHASAFTYQDRGILVTGWAKGGKTEALLAFMANGAQYVGDEWIYLDQRGRMCGVPEPIRVWDWHLSDLPQYRAMLSRRNRIKLWTLKRTANLMDWAASQRMGRKVLPVGLLRRLVPLIRRQLHVQLEPHKFFARQIGPRVASPDVVIFLANHASPRITVRPIDPQQIAERMVFSLQQEQQVLQTHYMMFRFAFPQRRNALLEKSEALQRERLCRLLEGKEAYEVYHPYPASVPELFKAIRPLLS